jgi:hypothetical protein
MNTPRLAHEPVYADTGAASFTTTLPLAAPRRVEVTAEGPLGAPQALARASRTLLVVPGQHVRGEGVVLELAGLIVGVRTPATLVTLRPGETVLVEASVAMLCGCPLRKGGIWNADSTEVAAELLVDGAVVARAPLVPSAEGDGSFRGRLAVPEVAIPAGGQTGAVVRVLAAQASLGNFGRDESLVLLRPGAR